ncbi:MAG TPA: hypothetical protein VD816_07495 [Ohtaekwangia sp.]|nr:hypothetical protein [Ohtaekwangia sp.]
MRKTTSFALILILLFNVAGYYGIFLGFHYTHTNRLVQRLDNAAYDTSQTITIKIPIAIPYAAGTGEFERVDGAFEQNGESYRLVKQKLQHDTLYMVCIKDKGTNRIRQALADYVKTFTDKPVNAKHGGKVMTGFIKDFLLTSVHITAASPGWNYSLTAVDFNIPVDSRSIAVYSPPPQS